jgi:hypothetical protein
MLRETYRHSASSATTYATRPSEWLARYGFGLYGEDNARTSMGRAAEHGCAMALLHDLSDEEGEALAIREFDQLMQGEVTEEREASGRIARRFLAQLRPIEAKPLYQEVTIVPGAAFGLRYPIKIVCDFTYPDLVIDTKATLRCPTACGIREAKHVLQASLYGRLCERAAALLYCSPSRTFFHPPGAEDLKAGWEEMLGIFRRIERLDELCATPEDALAVIPFADEHWYDAKSRARAKQLWLAVELLADHDLQENTILGAG